MSLSDAQDHTGASRDATRDVTIEVDVPGGRIPVRRLGGDGPAVLFVHGISADHTEWLAVARRLAPDHRTILPDLLGRGASRPDGAGGHTLADEADRLVLVLQAAGVARPLVAGHSHGASIALALAGRVPVAGLVLASPVTPWTRRPFVLGALRHGWVRRAVEPGLRICRRPLTRYILSRRVYGARRPDLADAVERYAAPYTDRTRARALLRVMRDWRPAELAPLKPPAGLDIRVVSGTADRRITPADAARWAERLGAPFVAVEGGGHGLTEEEPARIEAIIRDMESRRTANPEPRDR